MKPLTRPSPDDIVPGQRKTGRLLATVVDHPARQPPGRVIRSIGPFGVRRPVGGGRSHRPSRAQALGPRSVVGSVRRREGN